MPLYIEGERERERERERGILGVRIGSYRMDTELYS
jgi:hypothetical protein